MNDWREGIRERLGRNVNLLACCAVAALGAIAYGNSLSNGFQFDDVYGIVRNPTLRNLGNIPYYFTDIRTFGLAGARDWRPILLVTYAVNYAMAGLDPRVFRITNFLLHVGASWLIYLILLKMLSPGRSRLPAAASNLPLPLLAFFPAAVFAVHTVNSEAVDYISARSSVLAAFFYLLAFYCFLRGPWSGGKHSPAWHAAGLAAFGLGLGAKATVVTLPAVLALYESLFLDDRSRGPLKLYWKEPKRLAKYVPVAALAAAYVVFRFVFLRGFFRRVLSSGDISGVTASAYLFTQFRAWIYYLRLFFWPDPLITDFPGFGWSHSLSEAGVWSSLIVIAAVLGLAWRARKSYPVLTFFTLWFFLALLPEASFIPLFDAVTGYRAYLAYVGPSVVATFLILASVTWLAKRAGRGAAAAPRLACGAIAAILSALIGATAVRNRVWKDEMTLWSDVVAKDPTNGRAYTNLAIKFMEREDYARARDLLQAAAGRRPLKAYTFMIRGYLTYLLEQDDRGLADFSEAIRLDPRQPMPYYYRGEAHRRLRDYDKALADYAAALDRQPFYSDAYMGIALVRMDKGETDGAMAACDKITEIDPRDARGYNCLGILLLEENRFPDAVRIYQRGVIHAPRDGGLWYGLGLAYEKTQMYREAGDAFARAAELMR